MIMKKNIFIVIILGVLVLGMSGCSREEADLFDYSAAARMKMAVDSAETTLESAQNGWEMLYFIDGSTAGYNMLVKFDANSNVTVAAKNELTTLNKYTTDESKWAVIDDNGPVLTFNTYNDVLHAFSDPQTDGVGNGGDYEFIVVSVTDSQIKLKGKKTGAYVFLNKLADDQNWKSYFDDIDSMNNKLFSNDNILDFNIANSTYKAYYGASGVFTIVESGDDPTSENAPVYGFITTQKGIHLYEIFKSADVEVQDFTLGQAQSKLDGNGADFMINDVYSYFDSYTTKESGWSVNLSDINSTVAGYITDVNKALTAVGGAKSSLQSLKILYSGTRKCYVLRMGYKLSGVSDEQDFDFDFVVQNEKLTLTWKGTQSEGATILLTVNGVEDIIKSIEGIYTFSVLYPINPTIGIKLTENSNSNIWYNVTGFTI
jgi:hypothetical protein